LCYYSCVTYGAIIHLCLYIFVVQKQKATLRELNNHVREDYAVAWRELGKKLGVPDRILNILQKDHPNDCDACCGKVFEEWLAVDRSALWSTMLQALDSPEVMAVMDDYSNSSPITVYNRSEMRQAVSIVSEILQENSKENRYRISPDDWPNIELKHFTSVALIHYKKGHNKKEEIEVIADIQHRGEIEKITNIQKNVTEPLSNANVTKTTKDISEIFAPMETASKFPRSILIEGAPGIGKTTLSKEIVYQWSKNNLLNHKKLVVLVFLRDPKAQCIQSLQEFVAEYCGHTERCNAIIEEHIKCTRGSDIAVVLDGYDELPEAIRKNTASFFIKLIHQECNDLQKCMVVITSRLTVSIELHNMVERRVEILGFTEDNRKAYIQQALKNNSEGAVKLLTYLEKNPAINAYCYIPLNMTILLCLFKEGEDSAELPTTQTEINKKFICITISRFIITKQKEEHDGILDFTVIPNHYKPIFLELCQLAFQALCDDKIVFTRTEIQSVCKHLTLHSGNWNGLGLLKAVEFYNLKENTKNTSFNFLHLSLQETLAAYHITLLSQKKQISLLKENFLNSRYFNTWIMYVGLTKGQSYPFKHFLSGHRFQIYTSVFLWLSKNPGISKKLIADKVICLHLFQCFSEAENDEMCQYVGQLLQDQKIDLSGQTLNPVNIHTLGLFLGRSTTKHWKLLSLANCFLGDTEIEKLYAFSSSSRTVVSIDDLDLSYNNLSQSSAALLADLLLAWNIKRVMMYSYEDDEEKKSKDHTTINSVIDQVSKIDLIPNRMEIFVTDKSFLVICMQNYQAVIAALTPKNYYSSIHLFSCLQNIACMFSQTAQMTLMLAARSTRVTLHNCNLPYLDVIESVLKSEILSVHYVESKNVSLKDIEIMSKELADFTIKLGDDALPLHIYNVKVKTLGILQEDILHGDNQGTFLFRNCRGDDINEIVSCFSSFSNWKYFNLSSGVTIQKSIFQQITPILRQKALSQFVLSAPCSDQTAVADGFKNSTSLQHLSLMNCKLHHQDILSVCDAVVSITTLVHINLSGNQISNQAAVILATGIIFNVFLQHLELASCNLYEGGLRSICDAIKSRNILSLNISCNSVTDKVALDLADALMSINNIENLHMKRCALKSNGIQVLITGLAKINCLKTLDLSYNNMSHVNSDVSSVVLANRGLENLNLSHCKLQEDLMGMVFKNINGEKLNILNVSGNNVNDLVARYMTVLLTNAVCLHGIYLSRCALQENSLVNVMKSTSNYLKHLDLSFNVMSDRAAEYVADLIGNSKSLEYLDLCDCELQERGLTIIVKSICKSGMLKYVNLKSSQFNNNSLAGEMAAFIFDNHRLNHLCLSDCHLRDEGLLKIVDALARTRLMQYLDISSNTITDQVASKLVSTDLLFEKSQLEQLNFSYCQWQTKGLKKIIFATTNMRNLKSINFSGCKLTDEQARYLACSIIVNDTLEQLILSECHLQPAGLVSIFDGLVNINTLRYLDLSCNQITEEVNMMLAKVISFNKMEYLHFSHCFKGVNSSDILTAIASSVTLQYLDLSYNGISDYEANSVASAIASNKYLNHVNLTGNRFKSHTVKAFLSSMSTINSLQFVNLGSFSIADDLATELEDVAICNGALESICLYRYAIQRVKLYQVPISAAKLVVTELCINDHTVSDSEACTIESLISSSSSICHVDLTNSMISDERKSMIVKAMRKHSTLTHLDLSGISVSEEVEDDLISLITDNVDLHHLAVADCKLKESFLVKLPDALNAHKKLLQLNLSSNSLSATAAVSVAKVLTQNACLEGLQMACCNLSETCLLSVVRALIKLNGIVNLNLSGNVLTDYAVELLVSVVTNNSRLKQIDLNGCKLNNTGIIKLVEAINSARLVELTDLNLSDSTITGQALDRLFFVVAGCRKLQHLELCNCNISKLRASHFRTLHALTTLRYLDLSNNPISDVYANDLAYLIARNNQLQHFNLSGCSLASEGVLKIVETLKKSTVLLHLDLGSNYLPLDQLDNVSTEIAALINNNNEIEHLCLPHCTFQDDNLKILFEAMKNTVSLKCIDISCNQISHSLYQHVTSVMASNHNLEVFRLFKLFLTQSGLEELYDVLPKFRALQMVSLNQCHVTDRQISQLSVMMAKNQGISDFRITDCLLSDLGVCKIFNSLKSVQLLRCLYLSSIVFTGNSIDQVAAVIAANQDMEYLSLADCRISESGKVFRALKAITTLQHFIFSNAVVNEQEENDISLVIANNSKLRSLELVGCGLTENGTKKIGNALNSHEAISCLKMNGNTVRLENSNLLNVLVQNTHLSQLEMAHCNLEEADILALAKNIRHSHCKSFSHLNLSGNGLSNAAIKSLLLMVSSFPLFKHLELSECGMSIPSMELPKTLNLVLSLSYIDLSHNPIRNKGVELLAAFILINNKIEHLNLSNCKFQSSEINLLIKAMRNVTTLNFIDLSMNDVRDGTLIPIGPVISSNKSLNFLYLPVYKFTEQDLDNVFNAVANVLSLRSEQVNQSTSYFASVAQVSNLALQKLKVFGVNYDENADGRLINMQNILECFSNLGNMTSNLDSSSFIPNSLIIEAGLFNTLKAVENSCSLECLNFNNTPITNSIQHSMICALGSNNTLLYLEMAACMLKNTAMVKFAQAFDSLKNLLHLNISQNQCRIMQLSSVISSFYELEHLDLSDCNITSSDLINNTPLSNKKLKYLDLSNNPITDEAADQIMAIIKNNTELQHLNLSNCHFNPSGMEKIVLVLKTCTSLKYINFMSNSVSDKLADEIAAVIDNNKELGHVFLPDNVLDYKCINDAFKKKVSLKKASSRTNQVSSVKLENLGIQIETIFNDVACKSLTSGIKYLAVNFNFVSKQALKLLIGYLNNNCTLEHLEMAVSGLTEAYVRGLCNALCSFESLTYLSICCSDVSIEAASSLADVFNANRSSLQHIILHNCTLNGTTIQKVGDALSNVSQLKCIDLSFNDFGYEAVAEISNLITKSPSVEHLDLSNCRLNKTNVTRIVNMLTEISELKCLNLSRNEIPDDITEAIAAAMSTNQHLKREDIKI